MRGRREKKPGWDYYLMGSRSAKRILFTVTKQTELLAEGEEAAGRAPAARLMEPALPPNLLPSYRLPPLRFRLLLSFSFFFFLSGSLFFLPLLNSCSLSPIPCVALYVLPRLQESESRSLSPRQRLLCVNICQMSGVLMGPCHLQSGQCVLSSVRVERACGCSSYNV